MNLKNFLNLSRYNRVELFLMAIGNLLIAYVIASLALDSGAIWQYGLAILFLVNGIRVGTYLIKKFIKNDSKTKSKRSKKAA